MPQWTPRAADHHAGSPGHGNTADLTIVKPLLVALPGTGFDGEFAHKTFGPLAAALDADIVTTRVPSTRDPLGHQAVLDAALSDESDRPLHLAGISIGAISIMNVITQIVHRAEATGGVHGRVPRVLHRISSLHLALPPWSGSPTVTDALAYADSANAAGPASATGTAAAPGALSATASADLIESVGLEHALSFIYRTTPAWLAEEIRRSWKHISCDGTRDDLLTQHLRTAAAATGPSLECFRSPTLHRMLENAGITIDITVAVDDPVHPASVGECWADALPRPLTTMHRTSLRAIEKDRAALAPARM